jgi:hypothetical protein
MIAEEGAPGASYIVVPRPFSSHRASHGRRHEPVEAAGGPAAAGDLAGATIPERDHRHAAARREGLRGLRHGGATSHPRSARLLQLHASLCAQAGCLFELRADPSEHLNLAAQHPDVVSPRAEACTSLLHGGATLITLLVSQVARLRKQLAAANATVWAPRRPRSPLACQASLRDYKDPRYEFGWWGPFVE